MLIAFTLAGLAAFATPMQSAPSPRALGAPAADVTSGRLRLPEPSAHAVRSRGSWFEVSALDAPLLFDAGGGLELALVAPDPRGQELFVREPGGAWRDVLAAPDIERASAVLDEPLRGWVIQRVSLPAGGVLEVLPRAEGHALLVARDASPIVLEAWLDGWSRVAGEAPTLTARLDGTADGASVTATLEDALGTHEFALTPTGDRTWAADLPQSLTGRVRARIDARAGVQLARTAFLTFTLHERPLLLTGTVALRELAPERVELALEAWPLAPGGRFLVAGELWGRDTQGLPQPACWLARLDAPRARGALWEFALELDLRWPALAGLTGPFELRALRIQDADTFGVLEERDALALPDLPAWSGPPPAAPTPSMLGLAAPLRPAAGHQVLDRALMLVHGYCSGGNVWPQVDFTQPKQTFLDPNQNRTHDAFAQLLAAAGASHDSFGVVAHSQGGAAALHLLTFYESPLDHALGQRRIQSVATPYQGTPLASLGSFACGVNDDMTPSGAATWLANIPSWARAEVSYWTTSDAGSACNAFTSLLLADPEDGTVEKFRGQLPGANDMGHTTGWCHTTGMSYPANYNDPARNVAMDAAAAR
ncbi:MAG TPA: hypothetical protein VMT18_11130 [Planctomycetota bacterium]|nr:hypothetical protein [Planctomycetota bacterium]